MVDLELREIADTVAHPFFIHTASGRGRFVNRACCRFVGREPEALLDDRWKEIVHPDDLERMNLPFQRALSHGEPFEAEVRLLRRDGEYRWHRVRSGPRRTSSADRLWVGTASDVHDLRVTRDQLELTLDAASTGLWTWDLTTDAVTWTRHAFAIHGIPTGRFAATGEAFFRLVHPEDRERVEHAVRHAASNDALYECEFRIVTPAGETRWVANRGRLLTDHGAKRRKMVGTITDITSRKLTEREARTNLERYRTLTRSLPGAAVFVVDKDLRFTLADGEALEAAGSTAERFLGKTVDDALPPSLTEHRANYRRALEGQPFRDEHAVHGREFVTHGVPLRDESGAIDGVLAVSYDVTERVRAEKALAESERRFRTMADGTPVMIWVTDAAGEIEFVNRAYCTFFGVTLQGVIEGGWLALVHDEDVADYTAAFRRALDERTSFHSECRVRRADGSWRWLASWGQPRLGPEGEFLGLVGSSPDVTPMKEAEARLADALQCNDLFMAVLGHDLRNPLGAVLTGVELAREHAELPHHRAVLDRVLSSAKRMSRLIDQLLDVTRIRNAGGLELQAVEVKMIDVCQAVIAELRTRFARGHGILGPAGGPNGTWDPDRLAQTFSNLLQNALQHGPRSDVSVHIDGTDPDWMVVVLHNEGAIPADVLPVVFDPFRRARASARGGLGLGLFIALELVRAHGGDITVTSTAETGTTFRVALPRHARAERTSLTALS